MIHQNDVGICNLQHPHPESRPLGPRCLVSVSICSTPRPLWFHTWSWPPYDRRISEPRWSIEEDDLSGSFHDGFVSNRRVFPSLPHGNHDTPHEDDASSRNPTPFRREVADLRPPSPHPDESSQTLATRPWSPGFVGSLARPSTESRRLPSTWTACGRPRERMDEANTALRPSPSPPKELERLSWTPPASTELPERRWRRLRTYAPTSSNHARWPCEASSTCEAIRLPRTDAWRRSPSSRISREPTRSRFPTPTYGIAPPHGSIPESTRHVRRFEEPTHAA